MASFLSPSQQIAPAYSSLRHVSSTPRSPVSSSSPSTSSPPNILTSSSFRQCRLSIDHAISRLSASCRHRMPPPIILASAAAPATSSSTTTTSIPSLKDLPLNAFINSHGRIMPVVDPDTNASVFAVMDKNKKVQYIGFSKDLRNSLRILMGRRPEYCYFYKSFNLPALDQEIMLETRKQWFSELGAAPEGNSDTTQRKFWEQPADAGSISERGKAAAAKAKARTMLQMLADRGITEEMVYDPKLLDEGKCDILPTKQSQGDLDQSSSSKEANVLKRKAVSIKIPSGSLIEYDIMYEMKFKTNAGWMYDIAITKDDTLTRHRVIVGSYYPESVSMPEDDFLEVIMGFLLFKKIPRHTEGLLDADTFPINYFAISQVAQFFKDLNDWFPSKLPDNYWRFMRTEQYGPAIDPPPELGPERKIPVFE